MRIKLAGLFLIPLLTGLFSQAALAQDANAALKEIADIVASLNHFPSDADKARLAAISGNESYPAGLRGMATAVSNINHAPTEEGKEALAVVQSNEAAPPEAKELAGIIAGINHSASADAKARLAQLFP